MAVRSVDDDDVHTCRDERLDTLLVVTCHADGGAGAQPTVLVLAGERMLGRLQDVLDGDESAQFHRRIHDQNALEPITVHQLLCLLEIGAFGNGDELVALGHDVRHRLVEVRLEPQVAVGDDANDPAALDHRQPGEAVRALQDHDFANRHRWRDGQRVLDHARFEALDLRDLGRLLRRRHVLVDDAKAPFLRHRDGKPGLCHRVHGGGHERNIERDGLREAGGETDVAGNDEGVRGNEKDVVECQGLPDDTHEGFSCPQRAIIQAGAAPARHSPGQTDV